MNFGQTSAYNALRKLVLLAPLPAVSVAVVVVFAAVAVAILVDSQTVLFVFVPL